MSDTSIVNTDYKLKWSIHRPINPPVISSNPIYSYVMTPEYSSSYLLLYDMQMLMGFQDKPLIVNVYEDINTGSLIECQWKLYNGENLIVKVYVNQLWSFHRTWFSLRKSRDIKVLRHTMENDETIIIPQFLDISDFKFTI